MSSFLAPATRLWGAHAARVLISAARRNPLPTRGYLRADFPAIGEAANHGTRGSVRSPEHASPHVADRTSTTRN